MFLAAIETTELPIQELEKDVEKKQIVNKHEAPLNITRNHSKFIFVTSHFVTQAQTQAMGCARKHYTFQKNKGIPIFKNKLY